MRIIFNFRIIFALSGEMHMWANMLAMSQIQYVIEYSLNG